MGLVHTIPETDVTVPTFLRGAPNGNLPAGWLRSPEESTALFRQMFVPVSYAMQAMHLAAAQDGVLLRTTGRYRTYPQQEALFRSRYAPSPVTNRGSKVWNGVRWYNQRGAMAAIPGTSNHGLGLADDIAEQDDTDPEVESIDDVTLQWLKDNAGDFGFALDTHSERWHWHWHNDNGLTPRTVDVLAEAGIKLPDLTPYGFSVPGPTPTPEPPVPTPGASEEMMMSSFNILAKRKANGSWWAGNGYGRIHVDGKDFAANILAAANGAAINAADGKTVTGWGGVTALEDADLERLLGPWRK